MATEKLAFETADRGGIRIFHLAGKCVLYTIQPLKRAVEAAIRDGKTGIVFDLGGCDYMDSAGMGSLVSCKFMATREGGAFVVCNVPPEVLTPIRLARLDRVIDVVADMDEALSRVQSPGPTPTD